MNHARREGIHHFAKLANFREIGGLKTQDGHTMRSGVLFRSDELSRITDKDLDQLREFKINVIIDLRTPKECKSKLSRVLQNAGIKRINIPLHNQDTHDVSKRELLRFVFGKSGGDDYKEFSRRYYQHIAFERTSQVKEILSLLTQEEILPALIHCTAGRDRTGYISALLQLLAGVSYETVVEEYLMTNLYYETRLRKFIKVMRWMTLFQVSPERLRQILMAHRESLDEVYETIVRKYGSIETYLCEACEIDQKTIQNLKKCYLTINEAEFLHSMRSSKKK